MSDPARHRGLRAWLHAAITVTVIVGMYFTAPLHPADRLLPRVLLLAFGLAAVTWLIGFQVRRALDGGRILAEQMALLLTVVALVVGFFAAVYFLLAAQFSGIDTRLDALYFAMTTLATTGFGDVVAVGQAARAAVVVQMGFDLLIVTTALTVVGNALGRP
ncbi:potassium channel family protein [Spirillospora sp. CA-253888]